MQYIEPPGGRPWALLAIAGSSLLLNAWFVMSRPSADDCNVAPAAQAAQVATAQVPAAQVPGAHAPAAQLASVAGAAPATDALPAEALMVAQEPAAAPSKAPQLPGNLIHVSTEVTHSFARTFQKAVAEEHADVVSAVYARLFFWDLDVRRDLQAGDEVKAVYGWDGTLADIPAASYRSGKLGQTLQAYRYQASGDRFPSYWNAQGQEVGLRLKDSPIAEYEQVTALLKDRPSHRGMDFKTPVGTPIVSPRNGTVTRTNWNTKYNGGCVEVRYSDGVVAKFLHLDSTEVKAGQSVSKGTLLGLAGNTGRSTAPHLHYEMEKGGKVLDPVDYHGTFRRSLPQADMAAFQAEVQRYQAMLDR